MADQKTDDEKPRMPHRLKTLYAQILEHPAYPTLSDGTRFAFQHACMGGLSNCSTENNKWSRQIWMYLYADGPLP